VTASSILRSTVLNGDRRTTAFQVGGAVAAGFVAATIATVLGPLVAVGLAGAIGLVLLGLRWPLLPLFIFVALVPIEETVVIPGLGTLSRWIGIVFAVVYAIPRLNRLTPLALPLAGWAFVGWAALSVAWAVDPNASLVPLQTLVQLAVIAFLISDVVIHDPTVVRPLLWVYSAAAAATAAIGIIGYAVGGMSTDVRLAALAGQNPAQFASLLLPAFIFGLHEVLNRRRVAASGLIALLSMAGIALSGTRSVWLAAAVVILFLLLPRLGIRRAIAALGVVGVLVIATLQVPGVATLVVDRALTAAQTGGAGRTDIWTSGLEIFDSSPVIGVGYGNFPVAVASTDFRSANISAVNLAFLAPHSVIVGPGVELGAVGLTLLALFIVPLIGRRGWGPDGLLVQTILASLMIDALFIDIFGYRKQVWIAIGLASGLAYLARQARRQPHLVEAAAMAAPEEAPAQADGRPPTPRRRDATPQPGPASGA
jgi:O-antigen ligase